MNQSALLQEDIDSLLLKLNMNTSYVYPIITFTYSTSISNMGIMLTTTIRECNPITTTLSSKGKTEVNIQSILNQLSSQFIDGYVSTSIPCVYQLHMNKQLLMSSIVDTFIVSETEFSAMTSRILDLRWEFIYPIVSFAYTPPNQPLGVKLYLGELEPMVTSLCPNGFTQIDISPLIDALPEMVLGLHGTRQTPDVLYQVFRECDGCIISTMTMNVDPLPAPSIFVQDVAKLLFHMRPNNKRYLIRICGHSFGEYTQEVMFTSGYVVIDLETILAALGRYMIVPDLTTITFTSIVTCRVQHTLVHSFHIGDLGHTELYCIIHENGDSVIIVRWDRFADYRSDDFFSPQTMYLSVRDGDGIEHLPLVNGKLPSVGINEWGYKTISTIPLKADHIYFLSVYISIGAYDSKGLNYIKGVSAGVKDERP